MTLLAICLGAAVGAPLIFMFAPWLVGVLRARREGYNWGRYRIAMGATLREVREDCETHDFWFRVGAHAACDDYILSRRL